MGKQLGGNPASTGAIAYTQATNCLTDTFSISNQDTVQTLCGTNTGYHAYFETDDACNMLNFQLGTNPTGVTAVATRSWSIKVTQYDCNYENLAPLGCTQWHYGPTAMGYVNSFNWAGDIHLADQRQVICVRRERGYTTLCW